MELLPNVAGSQRDAVRNRCSIEKDQNTGTAQGKNTSKKSRVVERKKKKKNTLAVDENLWRRQRVPVTQFFFLSLYRVSTDWIPVGRFSRVNCSSPSESMIEIFISVQQKISLFSRSISFQNDHDVHSSRVTFIQINLELWTLFCGCWMTSFEPPIWWRLFSVWLLKISIQRLDSRASFTGLPSFIGFWDHLPARCSRTSTRQSRVPLPRRQSAKWFYFFSPSFLHLFFPTDW